MTVTNTDRKVEYVGDNSTTTFAIPFTFLDDADIEVFLRDESTDPPTVTLQATPADYSVSGTDVVFVTAPATSIKILIRRTMAITQPTDYQNNSEFPAETHETALDRGTLIDQQLQEELDRSVKFPDTVSGFDTDLPDPTNQENKFVRVNATADGFELSDGTTDGVFTDVENSGVDVGAQPTANFRDGISAVEDAGGNRINIDLDITNLTAESAIDATDEVAVFDTTASAPRKATRNELNAGYIASLTSETVPDNADEIVIRDDSAATPEERRMTRGDFLSGIGGASKLEIEVVEAGDVAPLIADPSTDLRGIVFPAGSDTDVRFQVPMEEYNAGDHIKLIVKAYAAATGNVVLETVSSLYEPGTTDASVAPTNQRTNTQTIAAPGAANQFFEDSTLEITDATGQINAVAVAATDVITVNLKRKGSDVSDTMSGDLVVSMAIVDLNA